LKTPQFRNVIFVVAIVGLGLACSTESTAPPATTKAPRVVTTTIAMHPDWSANNVGDFMSHLLGDWPFDVADFYSDRIIEACGGRRDLSTSLFRQYQNEFERGLNHKTLSAYVHKYEAEVTWYFDRGRNQTSDLRFVLGKAAGENEWPWRLNTYFPPGLQDFC
jgi:hypothetical protein